MNELPRFDSVKISQGVIERAIKVEPDSLAFRLTAQDRADIVFNDELRDIMRNVIIVSVLALLAVII